MNLGLLGFFKYYNFFIESFTDLISLFGLTPHLHTLHIILPVGISFYTFHGLSYIFDVYNGKAHIRKNWINYSLFVGYFPLLVAGPIERATHLLPQLEEKRSFDFNKAVDGLRQILWGLFKKVVIADNCAKFVDIVFSNYPDYESSTLILAIIFFSFQIYADFSGYTDIALGVSRLLGIELLQNFNYPYFSRSMGEFWRRWHMSLTSWFRDYLYIPLGGSRKGKIITIRNTYIVFLASGLWHGANWTFIAWGLLHAIFLTPTIIKGKKKNYKEVVAKGKLLPSFNDLCNMLTTFFLATVARIFFRSESLNDAFSYITHIIRFRSEIPPLWGRVLTCIGLISFMIITEWNGREKKHALEDLNLRYNRVKRYLFYYLILILIFVFYRNGRDFIYFQF
ncbi:MAG: MBOAT family O-acyltransferase [Dysgonomonas sp.]